MSRPSASIVLLALAVALTLQPASAGIPIQPETSTTDGPVRTWFVHVSPDASPQERAEITRFLAERGIERRPLVRRVPTAAEVRAKFPERAKRASPERRLRLDRSLDVLRGIEVVNLPDSVAPDAFAAKLSRLPGVTHVEPNKPVELAAVPDDPYFSSSGTWGQPYDDLWGHKIIDAEPAWDLATGAGVVVAISDTGIDYEHPDLQGRIWVNPVEDINGNGIVDGAPLDCSTSPPPDGDFDCIDNDGNGFVDDVRGYNFWHGNNDPMDSQGHGTHVGGTVAATANNGIGILGVAYDAKLMAVMGANFQNGDLAGYAPTISYAAGHGADVINMSWGLFQVSPTLEATIRAAADMGVVLVASAGNDPLGTEGYIPASYPDVIAVAATNQNDEVTSFSNYGEAVSLSAPGGDDNPGGAPGYPERNVLSLKAQNYVYNPGWIVDDDYARLSGTSMSAPHVSAAAALLLSRQPSASRELIRIVLEKTADDIGDPGFDLDTGHGRVNAFSALTFIDSIIDRPELVPTVTADTSTAAPGSPVKVTIEVDNVGNLSAAGVNLKLFDGDPDAGGTLVRTWTIGSIVAGGSSTSTHHYVVPGSGEQRLFVVVDQTDQIAEADESNNKAFAAVAMLPRQYVLETLRDDTGLSNPEGYIMQSEPAVFVDRAVWLDNRDIVTAGSSDNEIYAYTFSSGTEERITNAASRKRLPVLSNDEVVWIDTRGGPGNVYHYDIGTGVETAITFDSYGRTSLDTDGTWIVYSDSRNGNQDVFAYNIGLQQELQVTTDPGNQRDARLDGGCVIYTDGDISIKQFCLPAGPEVTLVTAPTSATSPDKYGDLLMWTQVPPIGALRDLEFELYRSQAGGAAEQIAPDRTFNNHSRVGPTDAAFIRGFMQSQTKVQVRDRATDAELTLSEGGYVDGLELGFFRLAWSQQPVFGSENTDVFVATQDLFPTGPQSLSGTAGNRRMTLNWADNGEPDLDVYRVYRRAGSTGSFAIRATVTDSDFVDTGLTNGVTYHYFVTALDAEGGESPISNQISGIPFKRCRGCPDPNQQ